MSFKSIKRKNKTKTLAILALLVALSVVISRFCVIYITPSIRISFGNIPIILAGIIYGPIAGGVVGGIADIIGSLLLSGYGWYPPLTVAPILLGVIPGIFFWYVFKNPFDNKKKTLTYYIIADIVANVIASMGWNTYWLHIWGGNPFLSLLAIRVPLYIGISVLEIIIIYSLDKARLIKYLMVISEKKTMNKEDTLNYIHNAKWQKSKPGLSRTEELLKALGNPEKKLKFVHIAGTNGKGSTAAYIDSVLRCSGYKTGLYTSPYINVFNERIRVNGKNIPDEALTRLTERIRTKAEMMEDVPTEFEIITAIAMEYFLEEQCDIVVLEVGMGGELDSTNVIPIPEAAVITALGLDHTQILGPTIQDIAKAKAGIIKGGNVIFYGQCPDGEEIIRNKCIETGADLSIAELDKIQIKDQTIKGTKLSFKEYSDVVVPLSGTFQPLNAVVAITVCDILKNKWDKITKETICQGIEQTKWPGRFEVLFESPLFILDGAHNPHGMTAAAKSIKELVPNKPRIMVTGVMADKDVHEMMDIIDPYMDMYVTVKPDNPRAMEAEDLAGLLKKYGKPVYPCLTIEDGVQKALELCNNDGAVCALGSLYFSADIRQAAEKNISK